MHEIRRLYQSPFLMGIPAPKSFLIQYLSNILIMIGAVLVSVQLRLKLTQGKALGDNYQAQPLKLYVLLIVILAFVQGISWLSGRSKVFSRILSPNQQFRTFIVSTGLLTLAVYIYIPDISQLQLLYFGVASVFLAITTILWPNWLRAKRSGETFLTDIDRLWKNRALLGIWLSYNIKSRYSQTLLGIIWIVVLPLSTAIVLTIAFTQFLRIRLDVPFIAFFLSALVPYGVFSQGVMNSTRSILGSMGLINQVYFPREILVLVTLGEALVDFLFTFVSMLIVNAFYSIWPSELFVFIPLALFILVIFVTGIMFFVSCLSVLIRDIPQLVGVIMQLMFYLTPILYPIDDFPARYRFLILINPIAPIIQAFRDIIVYHESPDIVMLYYPLVMACVLLYTGYTLFKFNEDRFADLL